MKSALRRNFPRTMRRLGEIKNLIFHLLDYERFESKKCGEELMKSIKIKRNKWGNLGGVVGHLWGLGLFGAGTSEMETHGTETNV